MVLWKVSTLIRKYLVGINDNTQWDQLDLINC